MHSQRHNSGAAPRTSYLWPLSDLPVFIAPV